MWIKLRTPITGLFFPKETLPAGAVISIGGPHGKELVAQGKAIEVACPASHDPDDVAALRKKYRKANGELWDERPVPPALPLSPQETATTIREDPAANLKAHIGKLLASRATLVVPERQRRHKSIDLTAETARARDKARNAIRAAMDLQLL